MKASLFARRDLSIGDIPVIEVSDSSEPRPNLVPIGPAFLDLKYVSIPGDNVADIQKVNHEFDKEIDQKPYIVEEDRGGSNGGSKNQSKPLRSSHLISRN